MADIWFSVQRYWTRIERNALADWPMPCDFLQLFLKWHSLDAFIDSQLILLFLPLCPSA